MIDVTEDDFVYEQCNNQAISSNNANSCDKVFVNLSGKIYKK